MMTRVSRFENMSFGKIALAIAVASVLGGKVQAAPTYTFLDLGTLGGDFSGENRYGVINVSGQVVGSSNAVSDGANYGFRTSATAPINPATSNLGSLGGTDDFTQSNGYAVNVYGQAVGIASAPGGVSHGFRTGANAPINPLTDDIGTFSGSTTSDAIAINRYGQVTGSAANHVYRTAPGGTISAANAATTDLGTLPGGFSASPFAINASGQVVGQAFTASFSQHAFRTTGTGTLSDPGVDLGTLGGTTSKAYGINDAGQVAGSSTNAAGQTLALRTTATGTIGDGTATTLTNVLGGTFAEGLSINNSGQMVGRVYSTGFATQSGFFADVTGGMIDLNTLIDPSAGYTITNAFSINDAGQITGNGRFSDGTTHAFLLSPVLPTAYFTAATSNNLTTTANFSTNLTGSTPTATLPGSVTDVYVGASTASAASLSSITVANDFAVRSLTFGTGGSATNPVTISGAGVIAINAGNGVGITKQSGSAAVTINAPIALGATDLPSNQSWANNSASALTVNGTIALTGNTLTLSGTGSGGHTITGAISGAGGVTASSTGTVTLSGANSYSGTTAVTAGILRATTPAYTPVLATASTTATTGGLDIRGGKVVLDYTGSTDPVGTVQSLLNAEYATANGFTTGTIRASTLAANTTIGYGDDTINKVVTLRLTLSGDANLDGQVDFNDFLVLQNNFGTAGTRFDQGNFNYDGFTDFNDFLALQNNFGNSYTGASVTVTASQVAAITAFAQSVPEPAGLACLGLCASGLMARRSRKTN